MRSAVFCAIRLPFSGQGSTIKVLCPEHSGPGAQDLGFENSPQELPKRQAIVLEKSCHGEWRRGQNTDPAGRFLSQNRAAVEKVGETREWRRVYDMEETQEAG